MALSDARCVLSGIQPQLSVQVPTSNGTSAPLEQPRAASPCSTIRSSGQCYASRMRDAYGPAPALSGLQHILTSPAQGAQLSQMQGVSQVLVMDQVVGNCIKGALTAEQHAPYHTCATYPDMPSAPLQDSAHGQARLRARGLQRARRGAGARDGPGRGHLLRQPRQPAPRPHRGAHGARARVPGSRRAPGAGMWHLGAPHLLAATHVGYG